MDIKSARDFVRENNRAVLLTWHADGRPQLSPVLCTIDDDGRVLVSSTEDRVKVRNLVADPRASLCVFTKDFFGEWAQLDGTAEVVRLPEAMDGLVDYYRRVAGEHPDWDEYRSAMQQENRVLIRIQLTRAGPRR